MLNTCGLRGQSIRGVKTNIKRQTFRVANFPSVIVVEIIHDFSIIVTDTGDCFGFILIRVIFVWRKGDLSSKWTDVDLSSKGDLNTGSNSQ